MQVRGSERAWKQSCSLFEKYRSQNSERSERELKGQLRKPKILLGLLVTLVVLVSMIGMAVPAMASDIQGAKTTSPASPNIYYVGDTIHWVVTISNPSGNAETNTLTRVWDTLPDGTVVELISSDVVQVPGDSDSWDVYYTVKAADLITLPSGRLGVRNQAEAEGYDSAADNVYTLAQRNSSVIQPEIHIEKTVDFDGNGVYGELETNDPGETASWKIVVCNTGYDPVYNITVTDTNGQSFGPFDLLTTGACQTFTYDMTMDVDTVNTATAQGEDELGNQVGPVQDDAAVYVTRPPQEVGGTAFPVNKWGLLAPWAVLLGCAGVVTLLMLRKRRQA
jgi:uncharacterized repeat protein (TIGR01451 family)